MKTTLLILAAAILPLTIPNCAHAADKLTPEQLAQRFERAAEWQLFYAQTNPGSEDYFLAKAETLLECAEQVRTKLSEPPAPKAKRKAIRVMRRSRSR